MVTVKPVMQSVRTGRDSRFGKAFNFNRRNLGALLDASQDAERAITVKNDSFRRRLDFDQCDKLQPGRMDVATLGRNVATKASFSNEDFDRAFNHHRVAR